MCDTFGYRSGISRSVKLYPKHALYSEYIVINGIKNKTPRRSGTGTIKEQKTKLTIEVLVKEQDSFK
jgi:hypothetical protein